MTYYADQLMLILTCMLIVTVMRVIAARRSKNTTDAGWVMRVLLWVKDNYRFLMVFFAVLLAIYLYLFFFGY